MPPPPPVVEYGAPPDAPPPPAPLPEVVPPPPFYGAVWIPGHWRWEPGAANFVWLHGHYAEPPRPRAAWAPGRWIERNNGWVWEEGRWD